MSGRLLVVGGLVLGEDVTFHAGLTIVVEDGVVVAVVPAAEVVIGAGDDVLDAVGGFVLPGLVDAHFHLVSRSAEDVGEDLVATGLVEGVVNARERLRGGVTAVRDAGCRHRGVFALRRAIELGLLPGPRAYLAGRNPTGPAAPSHWRNVVVRSVDEARDAVDAQIAAGADWVKCVLAHAEDPADWSHVTVYLSEEQLAAATERAHERGVRMGVHCEGLDVARMAVRCGVDALDHAPLVDEETAAEMAERHTVYVPTVWAFSADSGLDLAALGPERRLAVERWRAEHRDSVARAAAAGVVIAAGSDAAGSLVPADVLVRELEALEACGLPSAAVIAAATSGSAAAIGDPRLTGTIRPGSFADLVVVDADPMLEGWSALERPRAVVTRGRRSPVSSGQDSGIDDMASMAAAFTGTVDRWARSEAP